MKEIDIPNSEFETIVSCLADTFINKRSLYARQLENGSYVCIHEPLQHEHLIAHLRGEITLGVYLLDNNSNASYLVIDADDNEQMEKLTATANNLQHHGIPNYIESSRRGGHMWMFFEQPISGEDARSFGRRILADYGISDVELFPKQDQLNDGPGSLIRLPFGIHRASGLRYGFVNEEGQPLADSIYEQIQILSTPNTVSGAKVFSYCSHFQMKQRIQKNPEGEIPMQSISQKIKECITVYNFIGDYLELSSSGRGLCPFHDDHRSSFSVNIEENYWHCFAGCGGGSIIDFWMKWKDCDFASAISELDQMLLDRSDNKEREIDNIPSGKLLKAGEVAEILNISKSFVYQLMRQGKLHTVNIGTARRIHPKDLKIFIDGNSSNPVPKEILE